jgi:multiple sugar transport system substrate-binding protein
MAQHMNTKVRILRRRGAGARTGTRRKRFLTVALAAACAVGLAACSSSSSGSASASKGVVNLTFWTWVPSLDPLVQDFNKTHPGIHVTLVNTSSWDTLAKMFTSIKAGDPPDIGQVTFDDVPSLVSTGGILNLNQYGAASYQNQFTPFAWNQVDFGGGIWAIPQATGPTALYYNATLFKKYGLAVPTTWAQFAAEAIAVHKAHPNVYLTNFDTNNPDWLIQFEWQAGARWYQTAGNSWKLGFTSSASETVANYWQTLISDHAVAVESAYEPAWYQQLANGTLLTWPGAQWGTSILQDSVASGSGQWRVAPMPQWTAGADVYAQEGGSTTVVFQHSPHPQQALEFALWMNTDKTAMQDGVVGGYGWPAATDGASVPALQGGVPYFGGQDIYPIFANSENKTATGWSFGPDYATLQTEMLGLYSGLADGSTTLSKVLAQTQADQLKDLKSAGISVSAP